MTDSLLIASVAILAMAIVILFTRVVWLEKEAMNNRKTIDGILTNQELNAVLSGKHTDWLIALTDRIDALEKRA